ncbi:hypothetical protein EHZ18_26775 [Burkholderia vietnamiensis]|nr:hypothetical protein A8H33_16295 [Burkholderia vietnamiensis]RQM52698.1 hypothetical protein EHZ18_26775 [Burkholderia vietnamiensis]
MRNDMTVRTATNRNRQAAAEGRTRCARTASCAHARHYGIKDSKGSPGPAERMSTDVSARHLRARHG